jgi:hypothetical protein
LLALAAATTLLAEAAPARAYCREVTETPPQDFDPVANGCFTTDPEAGALPPLYWRNQCVSYSFNRAGSKNISVADTTRIAAAAFSAWSTAQCPSGGSPVIFAQQYPPVDCNDPESQEHNNVILFDDDGVWRHDAANALGYTTLTIHTNTGEILGAGIELNSGNYNIVAELPEGGGSSTTYDLASILTHEAGHFLGLAHSADTTAVMYAHYHAGSTSLMPDDITGICTIYSPDGSRNTSIGAIAATTCMAEPPLGFMTACGSMDSGTYTGSGPLPDGGAGDGGDPPCPPAPPACSAGGSMGSGSGAGGGAAFGAGMALLGAAGLLARRRWQRARGPRRAGAALVLALTAAGATTFSAREAHASVSAEAIFEQLVQEATAAAVITPSEQRAIWEGGHIVTLTRVHVDRLIAGALPGNPGDLWIKTRGGAVGDIGQLVEGEASFRVGQPSLVFLSADRDLTTHAEDGGYVVMERAQGEFPIVTGGASGTSGTSGANKSDAKDTRPRLAMAGDMGALVPAPADHWAKAAKGLPPGRAARLARDVLDGRTVDDAVREIAAAWPALH